MKRLSLWGATVFGILSLPVLAWAGQLGEGRYGPGYMWHGGWYGMFFGPLMMILFVALIVGVVVLVVRWLGAPGAGRAQGRAEKTPLDILEERFARGEIDKDEFEQRRQVLRG
jgi:putative membrane protein